MKNNFLSIKSNLNFNEEKESCDCNMSVKLTTNSSISCRHSFSYIWMDLVIGLVRCRILCSIEWWQIQWRFQEKNHVKYMIFIVILADIRLKKWANLWYDTDRRRIWCSFDWWQIQGGLSAKNWEFRPKNHVEPNIFIEIFEHIRLRIWIDLLNYIDRCRIWCSFDWWQIQETLWAKN